MKKLIPLIICFAFILCTRNIVPTILSADEEYQRAYGYFEKRDYNRSIELFKYFFNRHPGSEWVDDAQFYYAESFYMMKVYEEALPEFQFLIVNFPNSEYTEMAYLRKAQCLGNLSPIAQRDQTMTKEAIEIYEEFIVRYPYSIYLEEAIEGRNRMHEKLNQKLLETAKIYIKMGKDESAKIYLNGVIYKSDKWADKAYLLLGDIFRREGNDSLAYFYYSKVGGEYEDEAKERLEEIQ
ncbi:outer membrane protein assembly factor BamD [candidate division WOR-3 bacterium]|nr:outer membrane protein assembly factor BamD [candidate division WOR-3 bacterium]